jgi:hypothetical protein
VSRMRLISSTLNSWMPRRSFLASFMSNPILRWLNASR